MGRASESVVHTMNLSTLAFAILSLGSAVAAGPTRLPMTNALRLQLGLPPNAPRALYDHAGESTFLPNIYIDVLIFDVC